MKEDVFEGDYFQNIEKKVSLYCGFPRESSSSCAWSVANIYNHGLPTLSAVNSPDPLIVGRFFSCYEIIQTVCIFCALSSSAFVTTNLIYSIFAFLVHQLCLCAQKIVVVFF